MLTGQYCAALNAPAAKALRLRKERREVGVVIEIRLIFRHALFSFLRCTSLKCNYSRRIA
jgi:hypothetical protein